MKIVIVTPAGARTQHGNRHTAARWATFLRAFGHRTTLQTTWDGAPADVMIALHARRSHDSLVRFRQTSPQAPLVLVLTGTDLYRDIRTDRDARESLHLADHLVVLQDMGCAELSAALRRKTTVIYQSARAVRPRARLTSCFEVVVSGHLREEKDPFRATAALQHLPAESRIRIAHLGAAMSEDMAAEAQRWMAREPRYRWLGALPHGSAQRRLARSRLMIISSRMEGGANVVCEALASRVPVLASRISGNIGMLGRDYAGYFPLENEKALARLLWRAESEAAFYRKLKAQCAARRPLVDPNREARGLRDLLHQVTTRARTPRP